MRNQEGSYEQPVSELLHSTPNTHKSLRERAEGHIGRGFAIGSLVAIALLAYGYSGDFAGQGRYLLAVAFGIVILCQSDILREKMRSAAMRSLIERLERSDRVHRKQLARRQHRPGPIGFGLAFD